MFPVTNNMSEYEACLYGLEVAKALGIKEIEVLGDSLLVINQSTNYWEVRDEKLKLYAAYLQSVVGKFTRCQFIHLERSQNQMADSLANLASAWEGT